MTAPEGYRWEERGYHALACYYVASNGQIVGEVNGNKANPEDGFNAYNKTVLPRKWIGLYVDLDAAKLAVENTVWVPVIPEAMAEVHRNG